ncbi:MAG: hypothetical protein AB1640_00300 [bacterium]
MKRNTLRILLSFVAGMAVAYGLMLLEREASAPRVSAGEVLEVVLPDGTTQHFSFAEIERQRQELASLRQRVSELEQKAPASAPTAAPSPESTSPLSEGPGAAPSGPEAAGPGTHPGEDLDQPAGKGLGNIFSRIFTQPVMKELVAHEVNRQVGELAAVLELSQEQRTALEEILTRRRNEPPRGPSSGRTLEDELQGVLSSAQSERYREYTDKKRSLAGASPVERDLFELDWRLGLSDEQSAQVREILQEQFEKGRTPPAPTGPQAEEPVSRRIEDSLDQKASLDRETGEKLGKVLDESQHGVFLEYQKEKAAENELLRKLLQEEKAAAR